jgi:hypothetical protein
MSRIIPSMTANRMPSDTFRTGSCRRTRISELIAVPAAHLWRIARIRLPVIAAMGATTRSAAIVTFGHAAPKADIRRVSHIPEKKTTSSDPMAASGNPGTGLIHRRTSAKVAARLK